MDQVSWLWWTRKVERLPMKTLRSWKALLQETRKPIKKKRMWMMMMPFE